VNYGNRKMFLNIPQLFVKILSSQNEQAIFYHETIKIHFSHKIYFLKTFFRNQEMDKNKYPKTISPKNFWAFFFARSLNPVFIYINF